MKSTPRRSISRIHTSLSLPQNLEVSQMLSLDHMCRSWMEIFSLLRFFPVTPDGTWSCMTQFFEIHELVKQTELFFMCQRDGLRSHSAAHRAFIKETVRATNGCCRGPLSQGMKLLPSCKPSLHILHATLISHISLIALVLTSCIC